MKYILILLLLVTSCSINSEPYNIYEVTYEVIYPSKTVTKTCIVRGEVIESYNYGKSGRDYPYVKYYYIKGNMDKYPVIREYCPIVFKSKKILKKY